MEFELSDNFKEKLEFVADYIGDLTDDWFLIKKELLKFLKNEDRKKFSRRHFSTKKHILNDFDLFIMEYWENLTGVRPVVDISKLHSKNWIQRKKGWALNGGKEKETR